MSTMLELSDRRLTARGLDHFVGIIAASGFVNGEQVVVGIWRSSPIGRLIDVMWVRPDGERVLLAPNAEGRDYVTGLYAFDDARVVDVRGGWNGEAVDVEAGPLRVILRPARRDWRSWLFATRPRILRRSPAWLAVEDRLVPVLGPLLGGVTGVHVSGVTPTGRREWYSIDDFRLLSAGSLAVEGVDAGPIVPLQGNLGVGLSEFPTQPALVQVTTLIQPPEGGTAR